MSRMIFAGVLGMVLIGVAGCGSKPTPEPPKVELSPDPTPPPPPPSLPHEMDPAKHVIPAASLKGKVAGAEFVSPQAAVEGDYLIFRTKNAATGERDREVWIKLGGTAVKPFARRTLSIRPETPAGKDVPEVMISAAGQYRLFQSGYALSMELDSRKSEKLDGKLYLCLPDDEKSVVGGTFLAACPRQPTEPPGLEDLPYVAGSVYVHGAAPKVHLMTGYANPAPTQFPIGVVDLELGEPINPPRWERRDYDKPRVTTLIAGDGRLVPSRYEHSRLTPGRTLVFAAIRGGPAAWKWVSVPPLGAITVDLFIDVTKTGGIEVTAPREAFGKVQIAPAEDPERQPLRPDAFIGIAWQLGLEQDVVNRKALFRNLSPGRYDVRAAGQSRIVEVIAGQIAELDFDRQLIPPKLEIAPVPRSKGG